MRIRLTSLRTRVARRILGSFIVCAFVPIGILAVLSYRRVASQLDDQARLRLRVASKATGMMLFRLLDDVDDELRALVLRLPGDASATVAAPAGTRFASLALGRPGTPPQPLLGHPHDPPPLPAGAEQHLRAGLAVLVARDSSLVFLVRAADPTAPTRRLLWAELDPRVLWPAADLEASLVPGTELCVLQAPGVPLTCPHPVSASFATGLARLRASDNSGTFEWSRDGASLLAGRWTLFLRPQYLAPALTVVLSESKASILAPMAEFRRSFPLAVLLTLWLVLLLGYVVIRKSTDPLAQLQEGTRRIAARDFTSPVTIRSGDEFEDLAASFNTMSDRLRHQFGESERLNVALQQASESLRESETRLRTILETAADGIITTDESGLIESCNRTAERMFGYPQEAVIGQPIEMLLADVRGKDGRDRIPVPLLRGEREVVGRRKDGTTFPMELAVSEARLSGRSVFAAFARDIAARREAEQEREQLAAQLRQSQKLETIGTLAGGIAHDFNNILTAVMGYLDLALMEIPLEHPARDDLQQVRGAALRAKDLVRQILVFSRRGDQRRGPVELDLLIEEGLKLLRASLPATIEIRQALDRATAPVLADATQIHQVLMNLCTNAYHAMRETGGVLDVGLGMVEVGAEGADVPPSLAPGRYARLTVRDTGHGMDRATLERIFEPFFTTKPVGEGTGLGLSVVHGIVTGHGGGIRVQSEPGKGTTFAIFLPAAATEAAAPVAAERADVKGNEHVLVVDDDDAIARWARRALGHAGFQVTVRTSSLEALEVFRATPGKFDVVLTDQTMPGLTGTQLAHEIRRIRPDVPMILATGLGEGLTSERWSQLGFRECLMKPMSVQELAAAVRRVLDQVKAHG